MDLNERTATDGLVAVDDSANELGRAKIAFNKAMGERIAAEAEMELAMVEERESKVVDALKEEYAKRCDAVNERSSELLDVVTRLGLDAEEMARGCYQTEYQYYQACRDLRVLRGGVTVWLIDGDARVARSAAERLDMSPEEFVITAVRDKADALLDAS